MKKSGLLTQLETLKAKAEMVPADGTIGLEVLVLLLAYINDIDIETAINEIPL